MSVQNPRFWFSAKHKGGGRILHIISARTIGRARASFGGLSGEYVFEQLTESDLTKLTGFAPTCVNAETTFAINSLLTEWQGQVVRIEVAD